MQAPEIGKLRTQPVLVLLFMGFACVALIPRTGCTGRIWRRLTVTWCRISPGVLSRHHSLQVSAAPAIRQLTLTLVALFILFKALTELPFAHATGVETPYVMVAGHTLSNMEFPFPRAGYVGGSEHLRPVPPPDFAAPVRGQKRLRAAGAAGSLQFPLHSSSFGRYLTGSRGALLGVLVLIGLLLVRRLKAKGAILATILESFVCSSVNAYRTRSISISGGMDRLAIWSDGLSYFKSSPIYGIGPRGFFNTYG